MRSPPSTLKPPPHPPPPPRPWQGNPGFSATKIEHKISLRCVQNADILLKEAFVPDADRLPGVNSFKDTNKVGVQGVWAV